MQILLHVVSFVLDVCVDKQVYCTLITDKSVCDEQANRECPKKCETCETQGLGKASLRVTGIRPGSLKMDSIQAVLEEFTF